MWIKITGEEIHQILEHIHITIRLFQNPGKIKLENKNKNEDISNITKYITSQTSN